MDQFNDDLNAQPESPTGPASGPLSGVRVLDFCHFLAGPYGTLVLAELGADVIKIEDPDHPDEAREVGPHFQGDQSLYFAALNRGKRSVSARLSRPEGRLVVHDLLRTADVVVDNFRPGVMAKLGLAPEALRLINPAVVSCSLSGFGASGPYARRVGYDYTIQALAGVMSMTGEPDSPPGKAGISYVDHSGGLAIALAVCAALFDRGRTGQGRHIDLGLFDVQTSMLTYLAAWSLNRGHAPDRVGHGAHPSLVPAQTFVTRDGHLSLFIGNDAMWTRLVRVLDDPRLAEPELASNSGRARHRAHVLDVLSTRFATRDTAHWNAVLAKAGVPCAPVNTLSEALSDPQVTARGLVVTASHPQYGDYRCTRGPLPQLAGGGPLVGAPLLGEHTGDVLSEIGYTAAQIAEFLPDPAAPARYRAPATGRRHAVVVPSPSSKTDGRR
jgi:crotonobetainyl-CoA:carnitine CoA-transferase CaiB-like acyl-CoA transferase